MVTIYLNTESKEVKTSEKGRGLNKVYSFFAYAQKAPIELVLDLSVSFKLNPLRTPFPPATQNSGIKCCSK